MCVAHIRQLIVLDDRLVARFRAQQWSSLTDALDDVVDNLNRTEIALTVETEQTFLSGCGCRLSDDVVVSDDEVVVGLVDPDHTTPWIANEIVTKNGRPVCGRLAKAGDQITAVAADFKVEQIVVDLHSVSNELDRVAGGEIVVVNLKRASTLRNFAASVFWNRNDTAQDVVIDFEFVGPFERKFNRKIDFDRVVMDVNSPAAATLNAIVTVSLAAFGAANPIV